MFRFAYYTDEYFLDVERLIIQSYQYDTPLWSLSRHEFCRALHPDFKQCFQSWTESMGLYFSNEQLVAAVISEGCYDGDAFFLFDSKTRAHDTDLLKKMLQFAVTHLSKIDEQGLNRTLNISIPSWHETLSQVALEFGFAKEESSDQINLMPFSSKPFIVELPNGYTFAKEQVPAFYLSNVHSRAFNYGFPHTENGSKAFAKLRTMPHYRPEFEVVVLDEAGFPVGFAIGWMDPNMPYAELEPLAVVWWSRRMGIGKNILYELSNRIQTIYPHAKGLTGGYQPFYEELGFQNISENIGYRYTKQIHKSWDPLSKNEKVRL